MGHTTAASESWNPTLDNYVTPSTTHLSITWIALGHNSKLRALCQLPTMNPVTAVSVSDVGQHRRLNYPQHVREATVVHDTEGWKEAMDKEMAN